VAHASADIGTSNYEVSLRAGQHPLTADEGIAAACTAITLRMYAQRKAWPLPSLHVDVRLQLQGRERSITRTLELGGNLDEPQRARLADIAERTPVTLTLKQGLRITTVLAPAPPTSDVPAPA
jgi:putative redox protein